MQRMSLRRPRPLLHVCGRAAGVSVHAVSVPVVSVPVETDVRSSNARSITSKSMSMSKAESTQVKPFEAIPGPRSLPYIGTLYKYLPFGEYSFRRTHESGMNRYMKHGPIVREEISPGLNIVSLYSPEDIETVYRQEGPHPIRPEVFGFKAYREARGMSQGLVNLNGDAWYKVRTQAQKRMMKKTSAVNFIPRQQPISEEFIERMRRLRDPNGEVPDFLTELYKWAMESIAVVCFDSRLGTLDMDLPKDSEANQLIEAVCRAFHGLHITMFLAEYFKKKPNASTMRRLFDDMDTIVRISLQHVEGALQKMAAGETMLVPPEESLLLALFSNPSLTRDETESLIMDLFTGGIDSTAHTMAFNLNNLATNPECQDRLQKEIDELVPRGTMPSEGLLEQMKYLRAVTKETARLTPTSGGYMRIMDKDIVLSGYRIPAGIGIFLGSSVICRLPQYFENPDDFRPERWLRERSAGREASSEKRDASQRFTLLPFGHGPRMCIGRRFAEQEVWLGLIQILQNFTVEYHHKPIGQINRVFNMPDRPLRFAFIDRKAARKQEDFCD